LKVSVDPRGNSSYQPPNGGVASKDRYATVYTYDYQEAYDNPEIDALVAKWHIDRSQPEQCANDVVGIPLGLTGQGLGDLNGDGTGKFAGNSIVIRPPLAHVMSDPTSASPTFTDQTAVIKDYVQHLLAAHDSNRCEGCGDYLPI
jgi:hypothetical protein